MYHLKHSKISIFLDTVNYETAEEAEVLKNILSLIVRLMSSVKLHGCGKAQFNNEVYKTSNSKTKCMNRAIRSIATNRRLANHKKGMISNFFK